MRATRHCLECLAPLAGVSGRRDFCGRACRNTFNNRRMQRGAELYDLAMANRADRKLAKALGLMTKITRLLAIFRADDTRAGRRSWRDPRRVLRDRADLGARVLDKGRKG